MLETAGLCKKRVFEALISIGMLKFDNRKLLF